MFSVTSITPPPVARYSQYLEIALYFPWLTILDATMIRRLSLMKELESGHIVKREWTLFMASSAIILPPAFSPFRIPRVTATRSMDLITKIASNLLAFILQLVSLDNQAGHFALVDYGEKYEARDE
jgi:hypothetical protein